MNMLPIFIVYVLVAITLGIKPHHKCIHNKIRKTFTPKSTFVNYETDLMRRLQLSDKPQIRIRPHWLLNNVPGAYRKMAQEAFSAAVEYYTKAIKINKPVGRNGFKLSTDTCVGNVRVPKSHIENGIKDTDLIVYVISSKMGCTDVGGAIAWAGSCQMDQHGRPIAGTINICPNTLNKHTFKLDVITLLHELTHILFFDPYLWLPHQTDNIARPQPFQFENKVNMYLKKLTYGKHTNFFVTSPKVKQLAQEHFKCDKLQGIALENVYGHDEPGAHWEEFQLAGEFLNDEVKDNVGMQPISKFTLALLEDSGFYLPDYNYAEIYSWAKDSGCKFMYDDCLKKNPVGVSPQNFNQNNYDPYSNFNPAQNVGNNYGMGPEQFVEPNTKGTALVNPDFHDLFCHNSYTKDTMKCTNDYMAKGECVIQSGNQTIPHKFQYFHDAYASGSELSGFCPWRFPERFEVSPACVDVRGNNKINPITGVEYEGVEFFEEFGVKSRCATLKSYGTEHYGVCVKHVCKSDGSILIKINRIGKVTCYPKDKFKFKQVSKFDKEVQVACPDINKICNTKLKCVFGTWRQQFNKCFCSVGYHGKKCKNEKHHILCPNNNC